MRPSPDVLLVAPDRQIAADARACLSDAGLRVTVVDTFGAALQHLYSLPDLLISQVRLGDYNGLHLALRASSSGIPAILLGDPDVVLQREARKMGATYLAGDYANRLTNAVRGAGLRVPAAHGGGRRTHAA
jgi:DNA-binding response OmpR family regulator